MFNTIFIATFASVFGRAMQTQNVVHGHYLSAAFLPLLIAVADVAIVTGVVATSWAAVIPMWLGGALGAMGAMVLHRKFWKR